MIGKSHIPVVIRAGIFTAAAMITLFVLLRNIAADRFWNLHYLHILLLIPSIIFCAYKTVRGLPESYPYLKGLGAGVKVSALSAFIYCFFVLVYLRFGDPSYMAELRQTFPLGNYMSPMITALAFFTELVSAGLVITLIVMQIFKKL